MRTISRLSFPYHSGCTYIAKYITFMISHGPPTASDHIIRPAVGPVLGMWIIAVVAGVEILLGHDGPQLCDEQRWLSG